MPDANLGNVRLPRAKFARSYTGLGCWNSRTANLETAVRAMLGDPFAIAESPQMMVHTRRCVHHTCAGIYFTTVMCMTR